jgi:hypothetical protein
MDCIFLSKMMGVFHGGFYKGAVVNLAGMLCFGEKYS